MRIRLNLLVLGVASLIVVSFVVPLGLMVRQQADQRGRLEAERTAQSLAAVVVRSAISGDDPTTNQLAELIGPIPQGSLILMPDGQTLGEQEPDRPLIQEVVSQRTALSSYNAGGFGLAIPVLIPGGTVVVYSSVTNGTLSEGVTSAWLLLTILGAGLIGAALLIADRLGRSVVGPSQRIAIAAGRLGDGDLGTRVEEVGPPELVSIATAFNVLADRIRELLAAEREDVADLSHRLRTPLTAVRLQAEGMEDTPERQAILQKIDGLSLAVSDLISEARKPAERDVGNCDVVAVVRSRAGFWKVLADEQNRDMVVDIGEQPGPVGSTIGQAGAAIDALIGNVFSHTDPGTGFEISANVRDSSVRIEVADGGAGFSNRFDPGRRGMSGADSSGLGLDIARRFATDAGGEMTIGASPHGGAVVVLTIPLDDAIPETTGL